MKSSSPVNLPANNPIELIDLAHIYDLTGVNEIGRNFIETVRRSPPSRKVRSRASNMVVHFQSKKMGLSIQCESRTVEYLFALYFELSEDVIEFWDQPPQIKLSYRCNTGKKIGTMHKADFFVISEKFIGFVECKADAQLAKLHEEMRERYTTNAEGRWVCPPGEVEAARFGLGYMVLSPSLVSPQLYRNVRFLHDYLEKIPAAMMENVEKVVAIVEEHKALKLDLLLQISEQHDAVYWAIAHRLIYFNFLTDLLVRPEIAEICTDEIYSRTLSIFDSHYIPIISSEINIQLGAIYQWDGVPWELINYGKEILTFRRGGDVLASLPIQEVRRLIRDCRMTSPSCDSSITDNPLKKRLLHASPVALTTAENRYKTIIGEQPLRGISDRTVRYWKQQARQSAMSEGSDFVGLLPNTHKRGNRDSKIREEQNTALLHGITTFYLSNTARTKKAAYCHYQDYCLMHHVDAVSYQTFRLRIKNINERHTKELREGRRSAYQTGPSCLTNKNSIPTHGDRFMEIAHVDHTPLEITLCSALTGESLRTPWLTLLIDAYSKEILSFHLTFEKPSYRSIMCVLRECVKQHGHFPKGIVVDGGKEFQSIYFQTLAARYGIDIFERPPGQARFGAPVERTFGTTQTGFIHDLTGNTKNLKLGRSLSSTHHPKNLAIWTPGAFNTALTDWFENIYRHNKGGALESPYMKMQRSLKTSGPRSHKLIAYDENFILQTLPGVDGESRRLKSNRIKFNRLEYKSDEQLSFTESGKNVYVKYDPYDAAYAYVFADKLWRKFICTDELLREYTERGLSFVHMEVLARGQRKDKEYFTRTEQMIEFSKNKIEMERTLITQKNILLSQDAKITPIAPLTSPEFMKDIPMPFFNLED